MAKKLSINVPAATGFFSPETIKKAEENAAKVAPAVKSEPSDIPLSPQTKVKNKGGRPKSPKKKGQFTLTMDPDLYETLKAKAVEKQKSFSQLVTDVMLDFLNND